MIFVLIHSMYIHEIALKGFSILKKSLGLNKKRSRREQEVHYGL